MKKKRKEKEFERSLQLMTALIKTDIEIATQVALTGGSERDALRLRRQSAPLTCNKSSFSYTDAAPSDVRFSYEIFFYLFFIFKFFPTKLYLYFLLL